MSRSILPMLGIPLLVLLAACSSPSNDEASAEEQSGSSASSPAAEPEGSAEAVEPVDCSSGFFSSFASGGFVLTEAATAKAAALVEVAEHDCSFEMDLPVPGLDDQLAEGVVFVDTTEDEAARIIELATAEATAAGLEVVDDTSGETVEMAISYGGFDATTGSGAILSIISERDVASIEGLDPNEAHPDNMLMVMYADISAS